MKPRWNVEQAAFVKKVLGGYQPGAAQLEAALKANQATRKSISDVLKLSAKDIVQEGNSVRADRARRARLADLRRQNKRDKRARETEDARALRILKKNEQEYRKAIAKLANKVADTINKDNARISLQMRRDALAKTIRDMRANIARKKAAAKLRATAVQVNSIIQAARAR